MRVFGVIVALGLMIGATCALAQASYRQDVSAMTPPEITALQRRLTDAGCYAGPLDGSSSEATKAAVAACPDQRPQLRIETGMHVGPITQLGVDAACRIAATSSGDATARIWSLPDGHLLRTLRLPIASGKTGKVNAAAVSPDGRWVAIGGVDPQRTTNPTHPQMAVYIFDASSGALAARIGGFDYDITHLAYSPDQHWLAVSAFNTGVRVIDMATRRVIVAGTRYGVSTSATFGPDGRLYSVGNTNLLQRYGAGPTFPEEQRISLALPMSLGTGHYSIAIDPSGKLLAISVFDKEAFGASQSDGKVIVVNAADMTVQFATEAHGIDKGSVAWSRDGERLIAGGDYRESTEGATKTPLVILDRAGKRLAAVPVAEKAIADIVPCGKGFAVAATDPGLGLADRDGHVSLWRRGVAPDMRDKVGDAFTISADARQVRFGLAQGAADAVRFDLTQATLSAAPQGSKGLTPAVMTGLSITGWGNHDGFTRVENQPLPLNGNEFPRSLAIQPDHAGFALGSDFYLRRFDVRHSKTVQPPKNSNPAFDHFFNKARTDVVVGWRKDAPDVVWGVNLSADSRIVVAAYGDGTIHWHRWSDGAELLTLFVNKDTKAWVAWTPTGYYSASPGGEDLIGWHVNRGWDQAADFFAASRFRDQFARPDIVTRVLDTLDEGEAIKAANTARRIKPSDTSVTAQLPPVITIVSPLEGATVGETVRVAYTIRSPSGLPVSSVETLIDGRPPSITRGLSRTGDPVFEALRQCLTQTRGLARTAEPSAGCAGSLMIRLPPGTSEIGLFARAGDRTSEVIKLRVTRSQVATADESAKPKLYGLIIGVSAYANPDYALAYAAKDAGDFAAALENQKGGLYGDVDIRVLTDAKATSAAIRDGFDWLSTKVTSRDVGLVYLAGHGLLDDRDRFYFLSQDSNADRLQSTAIPRSAIADALDGLAGKALLFLDACHAGAVATKSAARGRLDINGVVNDLTSSEHGVVTFAASTGKQLSQENAGWNNGAFTKAVVEGLGLPGQRGKADFVGDGKITASELDVYVSKRVGALTDGAQSPVMIRPSTVPDFTLAATH